MRIDAENQGAQWSSRSDPRITRVGSILRRTRLDELPQLWCVVTGSMSLIGPRPERPQFDLQLSQKIPYYELRYQIRPGLSGWAQVNYPYGASVEDSANKLSYDLYYLKNFSFLLDILILFKTMRLVLMLRRIPDPSAVPSPLFDTGLILCLLVPHWVRISCWLNCCWRRVSVHGIKRRSSRSIPAVLIILSRPPRERPSTGLHYGDLTDSTNLIGIIQVQPMRSTTSAPRAM